MIPAAWLELVEVMFVFVLAAGAWFTLAKFRRP